MVISKDELNNLPIEVFKGEIVVVDNLDVVNKACEALQKEAIIGFDTETKPAFRKGVNHKVALMQLSTENQCFLFRLNKIDVPQCISDILSDKNIKKIGLSLKDDFSGLRKSIDFMPNGFIELQTLVKKYNIEDLSLQKIYGILFHKRITKGQRLTNWEAETLTEAQQMYAAIDAWACLKIYKELINRNLIEVVP